LHGTAALSAWLEAQCTGYAPDVRWSAPRRGVSLTGRSAVTGHLARELAAMAEPRLTVLRDCPGRTQSFYEFTIRFRLRTPGIEGLRLPAGSEVELERLRVLTHDGNGQVAVESCIETWTCLEAPE
jgi:hypothetical protein